VRRIYAINTFGALDPASSQSIKSDYSAGGVIGVDKTGRIFILESFMEQDSDPLENVERMFNHIVKYKCQEYSIERNRFEFLLPTIEKLLNQGYFNDRYDSLDLRKALGVVTNPYRNSRNENKIERIESTLQPLIKSHSFYIKSTMVREKRQVVNYTVHDDFLDWLQQAVSISYPPNKEVFQDEGVFRSMDVRTASMSINEELAQKAFNPWTGRLN